MDELAKALGASLRNKQKIVGAVERHLLVPGQSDRRPDVIHPSEVVKEDWCPRATYYRIAGVEAEAEPEIRKLNMEMVFERGDDVHRKWQRWFREMGVLRGEWECLSCRHHWIAISPSRCRICRAVDDHIVYREVPVFSKEYLIGGHADGDLVLDNWNPLIEIKSIGTGTIRFEAPNLIDRYSYEHLGEDGKIHKGTDWYGLWSGIRRPFASHLKQGMLYLFCTKRKSIVFLYDPKFLTAIPKEFEIKYQEDLIEDILQQCLVIRTSLDKGRPPKRPLWAEPEVATCAKCPWKKTCYATKSRSDREDRRPARRSKTGAAKRRSRPKPPTNIRFAETAYESDFSD